MSERPTADSELRALAEQRTAWEKLRRELQLSPTLPRGSISVLPHVAIGMVDEALALLDAKAVAERERDAERGLVEDMERINNSLRAENATLRASLTAAEELHMAVGNLMRANWNDSGRSDTERVAVQAAWAKFEVAALGAQTGEGKR